MAEELYGEAVDWDPKLAVALAGLGRIALARRDSDRAALYLERARAEQPEVSEVLYALGHLLLSSREVRTSLHSSEKCRRLVDAATARLLSLTVAGPRDPRCPTPALKIGGVCPSPEPRPDDSKRRRGWPAC